MSKENFIIGHSLFDIRYSLLKFDLALQRQRGNDRNKENSIYMDEKNKTNKEPLPGRMEVLRDLPADIMRSLSKEEIQAFLFEEIWPVSLSEKLEQYLA
jgi:hypothetical protein